jgi:streptogramin lyase
MKNKHVALFVLILLVIAGVIFLWITKIGNNGGASLFTALSNPVSCPVSGYKFVTKWGTQGSGNNQLGQVYGITSGPTGSIYVAERDNNRIKEFTSSGTYVNQWGSYGSNNGQFKTPQGVTTDQAGNIYVADAGNFRVQKFTSNGTYIAQWGSGGSGNGQFGNLKDIAIDSSGNIYTLEVGLASSIGARVQKFTSSGAYVTQWGIIGNGNGQFSNPTGITVDSSGAVYVTDTGNQRVQKFTSSGAYVTQWGSYGTNNGQFIIPRGIAISNGKVFVADAGNSRIELFTPSGSYLAQWGAPGNGNGQFNGALVITEDSTGNIYVADELNYRIQKFAPCTPIQAQIQPLKSISGKVYNDRNVNGTFDGTDNKLAGVKIDLYQVGQTVPIQSVITPNVPNTDPSYGTYSFGNLADGAYYVMLSNESSYSSIIQPASSSISVLGHTHFYFITITNGQGVSNKDFAVVPRVLS